MSAARKIFCERIATMRSAIIQFSLHDLPPLPENENHNKSARILRNGLAVQCFNVFEDFVRGRTGEILGAVSLAGVPFSNLPEDLRWATTVDTIRAIEFQLKLQEKVDRVSYAQDHSERISSTKSTALHLAEIAFFHSTANITRDQFRDALAAFSVEKPWTQVTGLSSRLGTSAVPAETIFHSLAQRRHQAAHSPTASVSEVDLKQSISDATTLAVCYDLLLSRAANECVRVLATTPSTSSPLVPTHFLVSLRFIKHVAGKFGEIREGARRCIRKNSSQIALYPAASARAKKQGNALVLYDETGLLSAWET